MKIRFLLLLFILVTFPAASVHAQQIDAKYLSGSGSQIKLRLTISAPAPQNVIIEQYVPSGTKIVSANPPIKKQNPKNGVVKWLLKGLRPGTRIVSMTVSPPLKQAPDGKLTYRHPKSGNLIEESF